MAQATTTPTPKTGRFPFVQSVPFAGLDPMHLHSTASNALARAAWELRSDTADYDLAAQHTATAVDALQALAILQSIGGV